MVTDTRHSSLTLRRWSCASAAMLAILTFCAEGTAGAVPVEPMSIGTTPQFFVDDYVVDNRWAIKYGGGSTQMVERVVHQPRKYPGNPIVVQPGAKNRFGQRPNTGRPTVLRDENSGRYRMWYQVSIRNDSGQGNAYGVGYAESVDGLKWELPKFGKIEWNGTKENNIVWRGPEDKGAASPHVMILPEKDRRGYRYAMVYTGGGLRLVGSHDGLEWDKSSVVRLAAMHSDTSNTLVFDDNRGEYVLYCRAKHIYRVGGDVDRGDILQTGESRRVARMASRELWTQWSAQPQNILLPDELDARSSFTAFYGITVARHADIYWGFLQAFTWNTTVHSQLAFSRNGIDFQRLPTRPNFIELGADGAWDDTLVFVGHGWVEVGDEWRLYYNGWDDDHGGDNLETGRFKWGKIGLATIRKEGFISLRGPQDGGVVATRRLQWPGGNLMINADATQGELRVRISDENRKVIPGFDYADCITFNGDSVQHAVEWRNTSIDALRGREIRIEFFLRRADLFTFRATGLATR